jgi:2-oxoglutarate/2-oxoacid ferredoxin oxidoreductase subunit beta
MSTEEATAYTKKDFMSGQMVRWCPGCGDYSILSQIQTVFAGLGLPREKYAVISGIGCSSRFPYYLDTYGFHTIHGRAPTVATGLKLANPELSVWVVTGDGDALSIGGNHLIHVLRRNVDLNILLFNNRIYGLTKGQYSPTSEPGKRTKSSPMGSIDHPFEPCAVALGAEATFVGRTVDMFVKDQRALLGEANAHTGSSFVEILQNCNIFNDGAFASITDRKTRADRIINVVHGEPLTYGAKGSEKGLRLTRQVALETFEVTDANRDDCLVHDETNPVLALLLARMRAPFPVALGVLHRVQRPCYVAQVHEQIEAAKATPGSGDLRTALRGKNSWTVGKA